MRKILLVEDEDILRETFQLMMATQPYIADIAENGQIALDICEKNTYDLILLDLMMPVLDGIGFLKQFMPDKPNQTKVIILSNLTAGDDIEMAISLGADRSILKASLSPKEYLSLLRYEFGAT